MSLLNPKVITAIEQLNYRVTVGDVAVQAGLELPMAQQVLMALATEAGGHLQVTETGEVAYLFSKNFRAVLQAKFLKLRLFALGQKIWKVLFYLIRISFGIFLVASICIIAIALLLIVFAAMSSNKDSEEDDHPSTVEINLSGLPDLLLSGLYYFFLLHPYGSSQRSLSSLQRKTSLNFLEAIFSFLFGDGNPNQDLEQRRWQMIGQSLRQRGGAAVAEQMIPYLDPSSAEQPIEDAVLPVLLRFNGQPEVSPEGEIVYHFPDLQTSVTADHTAPDALFLKESPWTFSRASSGHVLMAIGLGCVNLIGAVVLGSFFATMGSTAGFLGLVQAIYGGLLAYSIGFLVIPLGRYFWNQWQNKQIEARNQARAQGAEQLYEPSPALTQKISFACQFARSTLVDDLNVVYTTEKDLLTQEAENQAVTEAEWQRRLDQSTPHNR